MDKHAMPDVTKLLESAIALKETAAVFPDLLMSEATTPAQKSVAYSAGAVIVSQSDTIGRLVEGYLKLSDLLFDVYETIDQIIIKAGPDAPQDTQGL